MNIILKKIVKITHIVLILSALSLSLYRFYEVFEWYNNYSHSYNALKSEYNTLLPLFSPFTLWIGGDKIDVLVKIFYITVFLNIVFGVLNDFLNSEKQTYKRIFIKSGLVILFPLINFICLLFSIPAIKPDSVYDIYYNVHSSDNLCNIFYNYPFIYTLIYFCFFFIFCGLIGGLSYLFIKIFDNKIIAVIIPEFFILCMYFSDKYFFPKYCVNPISIFQSQIKFMQYIYPIIVEIIIMIFISLLLYYKNKKIMYYKKGK